VNDVLTAIRINDVQIGTPANTKMLESVAVMLQGVVFSQIALNYDQGFIVDEATDLSNPLALPLEDRAAIRDAAIAKFTEAASLMAATPFSATPSSFLPHSVERTSRNSTNTSRPFAMWKNEFRKPNEVRPMSSSRK